MARIRTAFPIRSAYISLAVTGQIRGVGTRRAFFVGTAAWLFAWIVDMAFIDVFWAPVSAAEFKCVLSREEWTPYLWVRFLPTRPILGPIPAFRLKTV